MYPYFFPVFFFKFVSFTLAFQSSSFTLSSVLYFVLAYSSDSFIRSFIVLPFVCPSFSGIPHSFIHPSPFPHRSSFFNKSLTLHPSFPRPSFILSSPLVFPKCVPPASRRTAGSWQPHKAKQPGACCNPTFYIPSSAYYVSPERFLFLLLCRPQRDT